MLVIASGRKTSRTSQLIEICADYMRAGELTYIVVHTQQEAYRVAQKAKELHYNIPFPITYTEFLRGEHEPGRLIKHFLIDNVDHLLQSLTHIDIAAVTILKERDDT